MRDKINEETTDVALRVDLVVPMLIWVLEFRTCFPYTDTDTLTVIRVVSPAKFSILMME
jgi:hypothetical protein